MDRQIQPARMLKTKTILSSSSVGDFGQEANKMIAQSLSNRKASFSNLHTQKEGLFLNFIQTKQCSQISKCDDNYKATDDVINESQSSAFTIGSLLRHKAEQVRKLCLRLEQRESEYLQLQKKMLELMKQNPETIKFKDQSEDDNMTEIQKIPIFNVNSELSTPANNNTFVNYQTASINENYGRYDYDYRSTQRLNKQKYLDFQVNYPTSRTNSLKLLKQYQQFGIHEVKIEFVPTTSKQNCLYQEFPEQEQECQLSIKHLKIENQEKSSGQNLKTPSFKHSQKNMSCPLDLTLIQKQKAAQKPLGFFSSLVNLRIQNFGVSCIDEKHEQHSEDFKKGFSLILSPKFSTLNFKSLASSRRSLSFALNVLGYKINQDCDINISKFKRVIRMQIETLNLVWKLQQKINRKEPSELGSQVLKGIRNDLLSFVQNFNKKHKLLKESGIGTGIFEDQTLDRICQILELAKGFPFE